jgi:hypothetical protein
MLIYVKLGPGQTDYRDERLDFTLEENTQPAGVLDYQNLNEKVMADLNANRIVQITAAEFFNILSTVVPNPVLNITTNYLVSLQNYLNSCPNDNAVLFLYQGNKWYKALWSVLKNCVGSNLNVVFRVGDAALPKPQAGDSVWNEPALFLNKNYKRTILKLNGLEIFEERLYDPVDLASGDILYYILDEAAGTLTLPAPTTFEDKSIIRFQEA